MPSKSAPVNVEVLEPTADYRALTFQQELFTGIAFELDESGRKIAEIEYREGKRFGLTREWSSSGRLIVEATYALDAYHGHRMEWFESGAPKLEGEYELGICLREVEKDWDGSVLREFVLDKQHWQFAYLEKLRAGSLGNAVRRLEEGC
jgi:hypothetical protein